MAGCSAGAAPFEEIHPGDVVWFAPGEKHWHGATATTAMTHIAIAEALDGKAADWMEKVTDEQYKGLTGIGRAGLPTAARFKRANPLSARLRQGYGGQPSLFSSVTLLYVVRRMACQP